MGRGAWGLRGQSLGLGGGLATQMSLPTRALSLRPNHIFRITFSCAGLLHLGLRRGIYLSRPRASSALNSQQRCKTLDFLLTVLLTLGRSVPAPQKRDRTKQAVVFSSLLMNSAFSMGTDCRLGVQGSQQVRMACSVLGNNEV